MLPPPLINCAKIKSEQNDPARKLNELSDKKKKHKTKFKTKVVDSLIFGIHCNTFFQKTWSFPRFSIKTSCMKA